MPIEPQIVRGAGDAGSAGEASPPPFEAETGIVERRGRDLSCAAQVLRMIGDGCVTYASLIDRFTFTRARLAYLLRQLEQSGLIARRRLWGDRRRVKIELTPDGRDHLARIFSDGAHASVDRRARIPRDRATDVPPCDVRGAAPDTNADAIAAFCSLVRHRLNAMPPVARNSVGAAVMMTLNSLGHPDKRGAAWRTDLDSSVSDICAPALTVSSGNSSSSRLGEKPALPAAGNSQPS